MNNPEQKQLLNVLLERADAGEHVQFKFIRTWRDYFTVGKSMRAVESVVKSLKSSYKTTLKNYCKEIPTGEAQFVKLLSCSLLKNAISFYEEEYNILAHMFYEFEAYAFYYGKFLDPLLFGQRLDQDLWDHRKD